MASGLQWQAEIQQQSAGPAQEFDAVATSLGRAMVDAESHLRAASVR